MVVIVALLLITMCGCSIFRFGNIIGSSSSDTYENADEYKAGSFSYDKKDVNSIVVNYVSGEVTVTQTNSSKLNVLENSDKLPDEQKVHHLIKNGVLYIQFCQAGYTGSIESKYKHLSLEIPEDIDLDINVTSGNIETGDLDVNELVVASTSGSISIGSIEADNVLLNSTSGTVNTDDVSVDDNFSATTTSGAMQLKNVEADKMTMNSTSGTLYANTIKTNTYVNLHTTSGGITTDMISTKEVIMNTVSGSVNIALNEFKSAYIESTSGCVNITLDDEIGTTIKCNTTSGSISIAPYHQDTDSAYIIGDGESILDIETTSGNVSIH